MIPAYSPQARGRSERNFGTWQGRLPQELRLAGITPLEGANAFLRERYVAEFNQKFTVAAAVKQTAFRRTSRTDLNWIFTVQTERMVAKDNTMRLPIAPGRSTSHVSGARWLDAPSPFTNTWTEPYRSAMARMWSAASTPADDPCRRPPRNSAVGKAGPWKPWKTKPRFPTTPTVPWKSRIPREIPTFPPRRRLLFLNPNPGRGLHETGQITC